MTATAAAVAGLGGHPLEAVLGAAGAAALQPTVEATWGWIGDVFCRGAKRLGGSVQNLVDDLNSSPAKQELLIKALEMARSASLEEKRVAIATSLATGAMAESDVGVAEEAQFLRVLADVDLAHIEVLRILSRPRTRPWMSAILGSSNFLDEDLVELLPFPGDLAPQLLAVLASNGLVVEEQTDTLSGRELRSWRITTAGLRLLDRLETD
jgi:hypothetical protein